MADQAHDTSPELHTEPCPNPVPALPPTPNDAARQSVLAALAKFSTGRSKEFLSTPKGPAEVIRIVSWAQVPVALKLLDSGMAVRLKFPAPDAGLPPDQQQAVKAEQEKIHAFFSNRHNSSVTDAAKELEAHLKGSHLFSKLDDAEKANLAKSWIDGQQYNPTKKEAISVSHIYSPQTLDDETRKNDMLAKLVAGPSAPQVVFEVPIAPDKTDEVAPIAAKLQAALSAAESAMHGKTLTNLPLSVWVGESVTALTRASLSTGNFAEFTQESFFKRYLKPAPNSDTPPAPSGVERRGGILAGAGYVAWQPVRFVKWLFSNLDETPASAAADSASLNSSGSGAPPDSGPAAHPPGGPGSSLLSVVGTVAYAPVRFVRWLFTDLNKPEPAHSPRPSPSGSGSQGGATGADAGTPPNPDPDQVVPSRVKQAAMLPLTFLRWLFSNLDEPSSNTAPDGASPIQPEAPSPSKESEARQDPLLLSS